MIQDNSATLNLYKLSKLHDFKKFHVDPKIDSTEVSWYRIWQYGEPVLPVKAIKQTISVHIWPNMVRILD